MTWKLKSKIIDVETAFLHGDLDEEIFMDCPQGFEHKETDCLLLKKSLYGLVQSARQFFKKLVAILKSIGFTQSTADPCLLMKKDDALGMVIIAVYVDDCYAIGHEPALQETIRLIQLNGLKVKVEDNMTDYLSCEVVFNKECSKAWLGQPHLVKRLEKSFTEFISSTKNYDFRTPGTPSFNVVRPKIDSDKVSPEEQTTFRSAVGTLLQFVKHSRPDLANPVRELSKCMDGATPEAMKELKRVIRFVINTKHYGLRIEPKYVPDRWDLTIYTDSDWAGDKDNRHSITGFAIFFLGVPIMWRSKAQKAIALSSTEAEYYAMSEAAKEIRFIVQILESVYIEVQKPIIVHVDNIGAIFMSENASATSRTRHVDARYHFVREFVEEGFLKIVFVKTIHNKSDMFTKNVSGEIYQSHMGNYILKRDDVAAYVSGVSEEGCWSMKNGYGSNVSQVQVLRVQPGHRSTGRTGIDLGSMSETPVTLPNDIIEHPSWVQQVVPAVLIQEAERWRQGCPTTLDASTTNGGCCTHSTVVNGEIDVKMGVK
jgi:hypothetical protein